MTTRANTSNPGPPAARFPEDGKLITQNSFATLSTFDSSCSSLDLSAAVQTNAGRNHKNSSTSLIDKLIGAPEDGPEEIPSFLSLSSSSLHNQMQTQTSISKRNVSGGAQHFRGVLTPWDEQERAIVARRRTGHSKRSSLKDRMRMFEQEKDQGPLHASFSQTPLSHKHKPATSLQLSCPNFNVAYTYDSKKTKDKTKATFDYSDGDSSSSSLQLTEIVQHLPTTSLALNKSIPSANKVNKAGEKQSNRKTKTGGHCCRGVLTPLAEQQKAILKRRAKKQTISLAPRSPRPSVKDRRVFFEGNALSGRPVGLHQLSVRERSTAFKGQQPVCLHESIPLVSFDDSSSSLGSIHSTCTDPKASMRGHLQALEDSDADEDDAQNS